MDEVELCARGKAGQAHGKGEIERLLAVPGAVSVLLPARMCSWMAGSNVLQAILIGVEAELGACLLPHLAEMGAGRDLDRGPAQGSV